MIDKIISEIKNQNELNPQQPIANIKAIVKAVAESEI